MSHIKSFGDKVYDYLESNYLNYLNSLPGNNYTQNNIIMPFLSSDSGLRAYLEKSEDKWKRVKNMDNLKKIITIIINKIRKYHSDIVPLPDRATIMIINSLLRKSTYEEAQNLMKKKLTQ